MVALPRSNRILRCACLAALCLAGLGSALSADIVSDIIARVPSSPRSFDQVTQDLAALPATGRCRVTTLGHTSEGRPIVMAEVTDFQSTCPQVTLFIVARQHGNEPAGTEATLAVLQQFAAAPTSLEQGILKYLRIFAVPVANPDGAAHDRRHNGNDADLNRDWSSRTQTETRVIYTAILAAHPDAVMDLHELPADSDKASYQENFLETEGACSAFPSQLCRCTNQITAALRSWLRTFGYPLNVYYDYGSESSGLCHRYLADRDHYPTFLCEAKNGPGRTLPVKAGYEAIAELVVANYLMHAGAGPAPAPAEVAVKQPEAAPSPAPPLPVTHAAPAAPAEVQVKLEPESGNREARLRVEVQGGADFSYVELSVAGQVRSLSNLRDNVWPLNLGSLAAGKYQVKVTAYGSGDTELASRELAVRVTSDSVSEAQ
jgi:hypothetical protein